MSKPQSKSKTIIAGIVGNIMEWYDFAVYGYFAPIIGAHFFPSDDPTASVIAAFGVFAAGFLMRPFGSIILGRIGDKRGCKAALTLSIILMAIPTFLIGVLPDHAAIGVAASGLLVLMRLLQGLSVGGEYTTSIVFLVETCPQKRRGFFASWSIWGAVAGILLGSSVGALISNLLTPDQVSAWGWRIPFLFGICIGFTGLYIRKHVTAPDAAPEEERPKSPILEAFRNEWRAMLRIIGINVVNAVGFYMIFVYAASWLKEYAHYSRAEALDINSLNMLAMLVMIPIFAIISDKIGRKPILLTAVIGLLALSYPLLNLMHSGNEMHTLLGQFGFAVLIGMIFGVYPAAMVEMVAPRVRVSALSVGYNLCLGIFGGTTPLICTYLITKSHDDMALAFYLMAAAVVSLITLLLTREPMKTYEPSAHSAALED